MKKILIIVCLGMLGNLGFTQTIANEVLARQYYNKGDFEKASGLLEQLFLKTHNDYDFEQYFNAILKTKKYEEADIFLKKLIKQDSKNSRFLIAQGIIFKETGKINESEKAFANALNNLPKDEIEIKTIAFFCYQFQAHDLVISIFLQGREILEHKLVFHSELIRMYEARKDKNMLIQEYLNAFETMPHLLPQAKITMSSIFENNADYQTLQSALLKKIKKNPDKEVYTQLMIWKFLQNKEYEMALTQLISQDKRIKDDGEILFNTINTFTADGDYTTAIKGYEYLLTKGKQNDYYIPAKVEMVNIRYQQLLEGKMDKKAVSDLADQYQSILKEYGQNSQTLFALKKWVHLKAYYLNHVDTAKKVMEAALSIPGISKVQTGILKLDLGDIYVLTDQPWDAILSYEQVASEFEGQPLGNEARFRVARLSFYQGNFTYAKTQADVLKVSTSQLIANDALNLSLLISDNIQSRADSSALSMYAGAELLEFINLPSKALIKLDSIAVVYPNNSLLDDILIFKSKIYVKINNPKRAVEMLKELIAKHGSSIWMDDAIFTLADLYERKLNDQVQAKDLYQKLISDYPGSMHMEEARKRFRKLRGDNMS